MQLAAADALLRMPGPPVHQATARVVEVLRRAVAADSETSLPAAPLRVLVANFVPQRAAQMADAVRAAGYEVVVVRTGRELMRRLNEAADIDAVIVDSEIPYPPLEDTLASLRYDVHAGMLPVRIVYQPTAPAATTSHRSNGRLVTVNLPAGATESVNVRAEARLNRLIESYRQVAVVRGPLSADLVKQELTQPPPPSNAAEPAADADRAQGPEPGGDGMARPARRLPAHGLRRSAGRAGDPPGDYQSPNYRSWPSTPPAGCPAGTPRSTLPTPS